MELIEGDSRKIAKDPFIRRLVLGKASEVLVTVYENTGVPLADIRRSVKALSHITKPEGVEHVIKVAQSVLPIQGVLFHAPKA